MSTRSTRSRTPEDALSHVLSVLENEVFERLFEEAGISTIFDLLAIDDADIKNLSCLDADNVPITIKLSQASLIIKIKEWFFHQPETSMSTWFELTKDVLFEYISNPFPVPSLSEKSPVTSHDQMLYGVKRNMADYPRLRDDKLWLSFHRNFKAIAATHAVDEVLDPAYIPDPDDNDSFKAKNTFLYSVFVQCLLTAKSKIPLRNHEGTNDGQAVYLDLVQAYSGGTSASLSADQLEESLKDMSADKSWTKPLATFLSTWTLKLSDLETVRDKHYSDEEKRALLIKAVASHDDLYNGVTTAKSVEEAIKAMTNEKGINFDQFYSLVLDRALTLDSKNQKNRVRPSTFRKAHQSDRSDAFKKVQKLADFVPTEKWNSMSAAEKKKLQQKRKSNRRANKTNTSPAVQSSPAPAPAPTPTPVPAPTPAPPPINNTAVSPSEASAHRMLNMAQQQPDSIVINGRTYVANVTNITYRINRSQAVNSHRLSLIDRGANGGLSGDDVRVIASSTTEFADVKGIAGAEVNDVPLSTVAGVIDTSGGRIIGIFHQYAHYGKGHTIHSPLQMEAFGLQVDDRSSALGKGGQQIVTPEGYIIPLSMQQGLPYMKMHAPSDKELETLPQVMFTSDDNWDPAIYDHEGPTDELVDEVRKPTREERKRADSDDFDPPDHEDNVRQCLKLYKNQITVYKPKSILPFKPDFSRLKPLLDGYQLQG